MRRGLRLAHTKREGRKQYRYRVPQNGEHLLAARLSEHRKEKVIQPTIGSTELTQRSVGDQDCRPPDHGDYRQDDDAAPNNRAAHLSPWEPWRTASIVAIGLRSRLKEIVE